MSRWALSRLARPPASARHGIGLPVSENGPAPADLAGGQVRVDQAAFLAVPLLDWLRPWQYRLSVAGGGEPARRGEQVFLLQATGLGHQSRGAVAYQRLEIVEAGGVGSDVARVGPAFPQHDVQHPVEQHHVGAGLEGQNRSAASAVSVRRGSYDDLHGRVGGACVFDAAKQHRMRQAVLLPAMNRHCAWARSS